MTDEQRNPPTPRRALVSATASNALGILPLFLLGAFAVLIRTDLEFSEVQLGLTATAFASATMLGALPSGTFADRFGASRALRWAAGASALGLGGVALFARSWPLLCLFMFVCGTGNSLAQPSVNALLSRAVPHSRQGIAFGIKQASVPLAGMLSGAALPLVGYTLGWRWAFGGAVLLAAAAGALVPRGDGPAPQRRGRGLREGDLALPPMVILSVAVVFGSAAGNAMGAFFVESAVGQGIDGGTAGLWLSFGGISGICGRVLYGWLADRRRGRHLLFVTVLLCLGAVGFAALGFVDRGALAFGTVLAFAAGWGWPGLFTFAVVRHNRNAPAVASGIMQVGVFAGALSGPPVFGLLVQTASYRTAWLAAAGSLLLAAAILLLGRRAIISDLRARGVLPT